MEAVGSATKDVTSVLPFGYVFFEGGRVGTIIELKPNIDHDEICQSGGIQVIA